ncbi:MAG: MFS transporter [Planctomycetota bacterium]|nr:MFS transporter [Planctomycetota bacterium]
MAVRHSSQFLLRRGLNWIPLMLAYAFLYMGRYNLTVAKSALGDVMTKEQFGDVFAAGAIAYGFSFLLSGPLTDRFGGRRAMLWGVGGALLANIGMGLVIYGRSQLGWDVNVLAWITVLYVLNMHFQSFGAVAIVTTKAPWFHLHERGRFSTIFGIGITLGIYFAFDWGEEILQATRGTLAPGAGGLGIGGLVRWAFGTGGTGVNQDWWLFFVPAILMAVCWICMALWLRNTPGEAGHADFDTGEASLSTDGARLPVFVAVKRIFTHPVIVWVCAIEFCSGILRNGIMHWYRFFAKDVGIYDDLWLTRNWGLTLLICGIVGANGTGWVSDKFFQSRRAPMCGMFYFLMFVGATSMIFTLDHPNAWLAGAAAVVISTGVIGVHGILSGTATADFGGVRNTGIVVGIVDGLVYLGTAVQSVVIGRLVPTGDAAKDPSQWTAWPVFLTPFALLGFFMTLKIWRALPKPRTTPEHVREEESEHLAGLE